MYILLTSFFISLFGIIIMIGRKLVWSGQMQDINGDEHVHPLVPDIQKIKQVTNKGLKKLSFVALVLIIRSYVKSVNLLKNKYGEGKNMMKKMVLKNNSTGEENGTPEVSGFLKKMSDYKRKIRNIKHKIKEEEEIV